MKIALFGGQFDPPHNGHLAVARAVMEFDQSIDELWLMPIPHHHWKPSVAATEDRLAMVKLMSEGKIKASDYDIRHDNTYAIDTVRQLQEETPNTYIWISGANIIAEFSRWKEYEALQKRIQFLVIPRNPYEIADVPKNFIIMKKEGFVPTNYSSTEIRERIKNGLSIDTMVPEKVRDYIAAKKLYK